MEKKIGHYTIVSELGRGGMGVVYKAHEESLNRFVAIKTLGKHLEEDESYVQRFVREAQSAAKLNHPNIVQIYTIDEDEGQHYFVMEYVTGTSLQRMLRSEGKMNVARAARYVLQTAAGLAAAHEHGIIHRDIKPANLLITERGLLKIADFGLALPTGGTSRLTATGMFMGTPGYLSPEQCLDQDVDRRTDIYSLGVTFYEALTGAIPFKADSPLALLRQIIEVEPPDVRELNPEVDEETRGMLTNMMAKDPNQRYSDCNELISEVQGYLDRKGLITQDAAAVAAGTSPGVIAPAVPTGVPLQTDAAVTLNTSPTMAVNSAEAAAAAAAPPPPPRVSAEPPPVTAAAGITPPPAPIPEAITPPPQERPERRSSAVPIILIVVVLGLLGIGGAATIAWKTGLIDKVRAMAGEGTEEIAEAEQLTDDAAATADDQDSSTAAIEQTDGATAAEMAGSPSESPQTVVAGSTGSGSSAATTSPQAAPTRSVRSQAKAGTGAQDSATPAQEPAAKRQPAPPPARGVAVIAVGERLLAGEAEAFIEQAFAKANVKMVDEKTLPEVLHLVDAGENRATEWMAALRPHARYLVLVHAEFLGERPLVYMGRRDVAFQSRLRAVPFDLAAGEALGPGVTEKVEYTHLTVERKVEEALRPKMRRMAGAVREQ